MNDGKEKFCLQCQKPTRHWPVSVVMVHRHHANRPQAVTHPQEACEECGLVSLVQSSYNEQPVCPGCGGPTENFYESGATAGPIVRSRCVNPRKTTGCL